MKNVILFAIVVALLVSCSEKPENFIVRESNGIKFYNNTELPNDPLAKLDLKKLFTINSDAQTDSTARMKYPWSIIEDKDQNIYIMDIRCMDIKKFDRSGKFLKTIGREGQGPGELSSPSVMFIDNDTLTVYSVNSSKISKFNLGGRFYYEKHIERVQYQELSMTPKGDKLLSYFVIPNLGEDREIMEFNLLSVILPDINPKSTLIKNQLNQEDVLSGKIVFSNYVVPFAAGNNYAYYAEDSDCQYKIIGYNYEGNKKLEIKKSYKKIRFEKEELTTYLESINKYYSKDLKPEIGNFKKAIISMHTDKYGRLLIIPNVDRNKDQDGVYIDIFKDGKFLNRATYKLLDKNNIGYLWKIKGDVFFAGTRIYYLNKEGMTIDVYDY